MKYFYCVLIPLLLQVAVTYIIIQMNTGNGSWVGLGVFLLAMPTIPLTAIINIARTKAKTELTKPILFAQSMLIAFLVPIVIILLYIAMLLVENVGRLF